MRKSIQSRKLKALTKNTQNSDPKIEKAALRHVDSKRPAKDGYFRVMDADGVA